MNEVCIELESHKILGVYIDKHLSWNMHIDNTCTTINNKIDMF